MNTIRQMLSCSALLILAACASTGSGDQYADDTPVAPPSVSRQLADQEAIFVGGLQVYDPRPFVSGMPGGSVVRDIEGTTVRPAIPPAQFEGISPRSTVRQIVTRLGPGYADSLAGTGILMWWRTDGKVLRMCWDWESLDRPPTWLEWGENEP